MSLDQSSGDPFLDWYNSQHGQTALDPFAVPEAAGPGPTAPVVAAPDTSPVDPSLIEMDAPPQPVIGFPHPPSPGSALGPDLEMPPEYVGHRLPLPPPPVGMPADGSIPVADALSGVNAAGPVPDTSSGADPLLSPPNLPALRAQRAQDPLANPDRAEGDQDLAWLAQHDPEKFATITMQHDAARELEASTKRTEAARIRDERANDEHRVFLESVAAGQKARQKLQADSEKVAAMPIEADRRGTFTRAADGIAAFLGGIGGGQNQVLAAIENDLNRDMDAQKSMIGLKTAELARRGASIGDQLQMAADAEHEAAVFRDATYARLQDKIETERQNFDLRGTQSIDRAKVIAGIGQQRLANQVAYEDKQQKYALEIGKFNLDVRKQAEEERKNKAAEAAKGVAGMRGGAAGGPGSPDEILTPEQFHSENPEMDPALIPARPMSRKQFGQHLATTKQGAEAGKALTESLADAVPGIELGNGTQYRAASTTEAAALRDRKYATDSAVKLFDHVLQLRKEKGWSSDLFKSDEWRKAKADWGQLMLQKKNIEQLGAISGSDMDLMTATLGASDPTSVQDPSAGIQQARDNTVSMLNDALNAKRRAGTPEIKRYEIDNRFSGRNKKSAEQQRYQELKNSTTGAVSDPLPGAAWLIPGAKLISKGVNLFRSEDATLPEGEERKGLDEIAANMRNPDPKIHREAVGFMAGLMGSDSPAIRAYAQQQFIAAMGHVGRGE